MGSLRETARNPAKMNAEKAFRRAYSTGTPLIDPDMLDALSPHPTPPPQVATYLGEQSDYGHINSSSPRFAEMKRVSVDAIMKLDLRDLEHNPKLPVEKVFVRCGYRDPNAAKKIMAYVFRVIIADPARNTDPKLSDISMRLPKGMTVYEIMRECGLNIYKARIVQGLIV